MSKVETHRADHYDVVGIVREVAKDRGIDIEERIFDVIEALLDVAAEGKEKPAKEVLDRLCGPSNKPRAEINITAENVRLGPSPPPEADLEDYVAKVVQVMERIGLDTGDADLVSEEEIEEPEDDFEEEIGECVICGDETYDGETICEECDL